MKWKDARKESEMKESHSRHRMWQQLTVSVCGENICADSGKKDSQLRPIVWEWSKKDTCSKFIAANAARKKTATAFGMAVSVSFTIHRNMPFFLSHCSGCCYIDAHKKMRFHAKNMPKPRRLTCVTCFFVRVSLWDYLELLHIQANLDVCVAVCMWSPGPHT